MAAVVEVVGNMAVLATAHSAGRRQGEVDKDVVVVGNDCLLLE